MPKRTPSKRTPARRAAAKPARKRTPAAKPKAGAANGRPAPSRAAKARPAQPRTGKAQATPPRAVKALPEGAPAREDARRILPIDIDPGQIEEALAKVTGELRHWANKGRYTKVRFKFRGKPLLPDLPLGAVIAAEGLTFYWGGILRALIVNFAGKSVLSVELINDSQKKVQQGKEALLSGEVAQAIALFEEAIAMERDNAQAHLNLGVALKLKGDTGGARAAFQKAKEFDPDGPTGAEAERLIATLPVPAERITVVTGEAG